ncbi:MAG: S1 RNA-binding domain-containing protein [Pyrinomonadaceae bacterium]
MTNQVTQDAEESATIEKTAIEQSESTSAAVETSAATAQEPVAPQPTAADHKDEAPAAPLEQQAPAEMPAPSAVTGEQSAPPEETSSVPDAQPNQVETDPVEDAAPSSDIDFGAILEQFEQEQTVYHPGELVEGTILGVTDRGVLIDFGYKSEGFVPVEELTGPDGQLTVSVGDTIEVVIRNINSGDSAPQLSRTDALGRKVWDEIEAAFNAETPVIARVIDKTKGGLRVDVNGIEAFLPGSQIDSRPIRSLDNYIGQELEAKVIKFSRRRNNIVLSRKALTDEVVNAQKAETLANIDLGYVVEGTIKNLTEYGAFVDIGGIDGLLHVTDMSWGRLHHPADQFKVNDHIQVKVLKLDREKEKVSLGYKQLLPDPWSTVVEVYPVDTHLKGIISSVTDYGIFVELEAGVEGLVHVSEISWARRAQSPKRIYHKGQEVEVQVLGVDTVEKRISLSMKHFQENPWDMVDIRYPIGSKIRGRVRNLTDFGAFIELEEGIDGLVHVSDISWAKKINHPKDVLKKDQEVEAIVTSIDKNGQRLSLSMKDLTPSAWEGFVATHRPGDVVKGKVSRFTNFGVFVELGEGLEGLCHISELSDDRVDRAEDFAQLGQEMDFKILRIEAGDQKIGLSHRAVGKEDEVTTYTETKSYSSEAKGGMASLGELANLKFGNAAEEAPAEEAPKETKKAKKAAKAAKAEEEAALAKAVTPDQPTVDESPAAEKADEPSATVEDAPAAAEETPVEDVPVTDPAAEAVAETEDPAENTTNASVADETAAAGEPDEAPSDAVVAGENGPDEAPAGETETKSA